jgi:hypothetical protein
MSGLTNYKVSGTDLSGIFLANRGNGSVPNTGFVANINGTNKDLSLIFEPSGNASSNAMISNSTGYVAINGLDLRNIFASINATFGPTATGTYSISVVSIYTVYTFTGDGSFNFNSSGTTLNYIVVGGGGGGGGGGKNVNGTYNNYGGGGGGGGGIVNGYITVDNNTYNITIGSGGGGGSEFNGYGNSNTSGSPGNPSTFNNITASGGQGGIRGGSAGGAGGAAGSGSSGIGGAGAGYEYNAGVSGSNGTFIFGNYYCGGGGGGTGGTINGGYNAGLGGSGGGGAGGKVYNTQINPTQGTDGYGGGGGGGGGGLHSLYTQNGAKGGSGVVILYYINPSSQPTILGGSVQTINGHQSYFFTSSSSSITFGSSYSGIKLYYVIVGGGNNGNFPDGGLGGQIITGNINITSNIQYSITVGGTGSSSIFNSITAAGGYDTNGLFVSDLNYNLGGKGGSGSYDYIPEGNTYFNVSATNGIKNGGNGAYNVHANGEDATGYGGGGGGAGGTYNEFNGLWNQISSPGNGFQGCVILYI